VIGRIVIPISLCFVAVLAPTQAWADEQNSATGTVEQIAIPVKIEPGELRVYDVAVKMTGRMPGGDKQQPADFDATYAIQVQHQYGRREADGLLPLEISARKAEATVGGQKLTLLGASFPKLTLLLDKSHRIDSAFGLPDPRSGNQMLGLNYVNLIVLFFVPDGDQPHPVGDSSAGSGWASKVKMPGAKDKIDVVTNIVSTGQEKGVKTVRVHQVWGWYVQKMADGSPAYTRFTVDSTFELDTGKLLRSHAETLVYAKNPEVYTQEQQPYKVNTKIDISLVTGRADG